jgi:biuret amidohydrolase
VQTSPLIINRGQVVLLVIDMQRDFCSPGGYAHTAGLDIAPLRAIIPAVDSVIGAARNAGIPVIFTREGHLSDLSDCSAAKLERSERAGAKIGSPGPLGRLLIRGEYGQDVITELAPTPGEAVIDKRGYSAFPHTPLQTLLDQKQIRQLIFTGVTTEVCVHSTLRDAIDRGYRCITVSDACASPHPHLHQAALEMISVEGGIFGEVCDSAAVVAALAN